MLEEKLQPLFGLLQRMEVDLQGLMPLQPWFKRLSMRWPAVPTLTPWTPNQQLSSPPLPSLQPSLYRCIFLNFLLGREEEEMKGGLVTDVYLLLLIGPEKVKAEPCQRAAFGVHHHMVQGLALPGGRGIQDSEGLHS